MKKIRDAMQETVLKWIVREHPREVWAIGGMPSDVTFGDLKKSLDEGFGMGRLATSGDTGTRELILGRLAEILGTKVDSLVEESNRRFVERERREYAERSSPRLREVDWNAMRKAVERVASDSEALAKVLELADGLKLVDAIGKRGIDETMRRLDAASDRIDRAKRTLADARRLSRDD